jgi:hypothetical protein
MDGDTRDDPRASPGTTLDLRKLPLEETQGGIFKAYANVVNMDWTLYDCRIRFGELLQVTNDDSPSWDNQRAIVRESVAVRLPWHQAKALRTMLDGVIRNYEAINGELGNIKLPAPPKLD